MTDDHGQLSSSDGDLDQQQRSMSRRSQEDASEQPVSADLDPMQTSMGSAAQSDENDLDDDALGDDASIDDEEDDALPT